MLGGSHQSPISRVIYTFRMSFRYRFNLAIIMRESTLEHPWDISFRQLRSIGIKVIVLDFDGVLAPHGDNRPIKLILDWLDNGIDLIGGENVFVLSNNPTLARVEFFGKRFPNVRWVTGFLPKPYPDGLVQIISLAQVSPQEVLMVDDRLMTGVLCSCIAKTRVCYIRRPTMDFSKRTAKEFLYMVIRALERQVFGWISARGQLIER
jgi:uncharacterized protein